MQEHDDDLNARKHDEVEGKENKGEPTPQAEPDNGGDWFYQLKTLLLQRGQRLEKTGSGDTAQFLVDTTPPIRNELSVGRKGELIDSFGKKFEEGFEGWKPGQKLNSRFTVQRTREGNGVQLIVADSVVGDVRHADIFELTDLPETLEAELLKVGVAEVDADIVITGPARYEVSNMFRYEARIDKIFGIQPPFDGDFDALVPNQQVLVEGKVISYRQAEQPNGSEYGYCHVELPNGDVVPIVMWNGYLSYEGGGLEVLDPPHPVAGDAVQINSTFGNPGARYGRNEENQLFAYFTRSTYLQGASPERQNHYDVQREEVSKFIEAFNKTEDPKEARLILSQIMRSYIIQGSSFSKLGLTNDEQRRIQQAVEAKFKDTEDRPINFLEDTYVAEEINRVWGVDLYSMSRREFFDFCMGFARGEINYQEPGSIDYPYRMLEKALNREQQLQILTTAVRQLSGRVIGKKVYHTNKDIWGSEAVRPGEITDPDHTDWHIGYLFEQSMSYLSGYCDPEVADVLIELAEQMYTQERFRKDQDRAEGRDFHEFKIFNTMQRNVEEALIFDGTEIVGVQNRQVIEKYEGLLPVLSQLSSKMKWEAWNNEGRYRVWEYVDECIQAITRAQDFIRASNYALN